MLLEEQDRLIFERKPVAPALVVRPSWEGVEVEVDEGCSDPDTCSTFLEAVANAHTY